jgi:hypothetical protein
MEAPLEAWNNLSYFDGIMFTVWLGILYYGKNLIDQWFGK